MFQFTKSYIRLQKLRGQQAKMSSWHRTGVSKGAGSTTGKVCQCYARIPVTVKTGQSDKCFTSFSCKKKLPESSGNLEQAACISLGCSCMLRGKIRLKSRCQLDSFSLRLPQLSCNYNILIIKMQCPFLFLCYISWNKNISCKAPSIIVILRFFTT